MKYNINNIDNISELSISDNIKIITLSDIHGDIQSLIIALRDCGNVIKKKKDFIFDNKSIDNNLEELLLIDISNNEDNYIDDLNYEWCGDNTHIVIVGDILDAKRDKNDIIIKKKITISSNKFIKIIEEKDYGANEYPQIEIKIFKFINSLNKQAIKSGGRIIKTFGNHEICNILSNNYEDFILKYSYDETIKMTNYYKKENRLDSFKIGNEGYKLLIEDGIYILFKINNNLFIHGQLINDHSNSELSKMTFEDYNYINYIINFNSNLLYKSNIKLKSIIINNLIDIYKTIGIDPNGPLWNRILGNITERFQNNNNFCRDIKNIFTILKDNNLFDDDINDLRIIIGHCPQSFSTQYDEPNITFSHIIEENDIKQILGPQLEIVKDKLIIPETLTLKDEHYKKYNELSGNTNILNDKSFILNNNSNIKYDIKYRGVSDLNKKIVFGISMECDKDNDSSDSHIYKVDIASSRGFDNKMILKEAQLSEQNETKHLLSRTPQILQILNNKTNIIRSKLNNTSIHQPRIII
jgi:hypothetical protein